MRLTIVCLFAFISLAVKGQVDIVNTSLTKPELAFLYGAVSNTVKVSGEKGNVYTLKCSRSVVTKGDSINQFVLVPGITVLHDTLKVLLKGKVVFTKFIQVKKLESPEITVGGKTDKTITKADLSAYPFLTVIKKDFYKPYKPEIVSF